MSRVIQAFAQFLDGAADPISNGWLRFLEPNTVNTNKNTFKDSSETIANTNPLQLDAEGRCGDVFGTGPFRVILYTNDELLNQPAEQIAVFDPVGGAQGVSDFNDYDASATYAAAAIVKASDGAFYESLASDNINNDPTTSPSYWKKIAFLEYYNATISYSIGDRVIDDINGIEYISLTDLNLGNQPSTDGGTNWDNFAVYASAAEVRTEIDAGLVEIAAAGDAELVDIAAAGDDELAQIAAAGDAELVDIEDEGDTQVARVLSAGTVTYKSTRQAYLAGPDLEATPGTIETSATETGDLRSAYHDLGSDMLTGSRGGMIITKNKGVGECRVQASILDEARDKLVTNDTDAVITNASALQQFLAYGVQLGNTSELTSGNLYAFNTTHKVVLDGNEWHYNPVSGFAMCKYLGTGSALNIQHPMGVEPLFFAIKDLDTVYGWLTGRFDTNKYMALEGTAAEQTDITRLPSAPTDTYISIGTQAGVNTLNDEYFLFGWFGDSLDDLKVGMRGVRGVTASWLSTGAETVDTGITDIQAIVFKSTTNTGDWYILNKASGFGNFTILNDTDAESVQTGVSVSGSEVTLTAHSEDYIVIVIGSTADRPDNFLKNGVKVLRKVGTAATGHRVDLGAAFSGGDNGGMVFGRDVNSVVNNVLCDTLNGAGANLYTSTDDDLQSLATIIESFGTTGITLGSAAAFNSTNLNQYTAFNTTHKTTTVDGLEWSYNPLTGFAMCKYTGDGVAGRTLTHPMGKKLRMGWFKDLDAVTNWPVYLDTVGATKVMYLDTTNGAGTLSTIFNDAEPDDTTITLGDSATINTLNEEYVFYGWFGDDLSDITADMTGERGVSAMWQYSGGSGAMAVDTGIDDIAYVLFKKSSSTGSWLLKNMKTGTAYALDDTAVEFAETGISVDGRFVSYAGSADTYEFIAFGYKADTGVDNDVILPASVSEPAIVSMANGFAEYGQIDVIDELTASQTLNVTGTAGKKFIVLKADGLLYFTSSRPTYERDFTPYANGLYTYDIDRAKMYNNGVADTALVIGECMLDAVGNVYDIKTYARGDIYISEGFTPIVLTSVELSNQFGHLEVSVEILAWAGDERLQEIYAEFSGSNYGSYISSFTEDEIIHYTSNNLSNAAIDKIQVLTRRNF